MPKVELQVEEGDRKTYEVSVREVGGSGGGGSSSGCLIFIAIGLIGLMGGAAMAMF
jgi:hypothetical protein